MLSLWTCKSSGKPVKSYAYPLLIHSISRSIEPYVLAFLGSNYTSAMVSPYVSENFTSQDYLIPYAKAKWQASMPNCPI